MFQIFALLLVILCSLFQSCTSAKSKAADIDVSSPNGVYRAKITFNRGADGLEKGSFQFFKAEKIIREYELRQQDQYEPTVRSLVPVVEWVEPNVLRLGAERPKNNFTDQLVIDNATDESFTYVSISYDRYESFEIFDMHPADQIKIHATPRFSPKGTHNNSVGYSGITSSGRKFGNVVVTRERISSSDGPLDLQIRITSKDLK